MRFFARKVGPTLNQALNVQGLFFWPPQTRSTQCINWLPPSAPCSWDVTFRMATTCVISRIESKQVQHWCLAKTWLSSWYFRKNPRICSRCLTTNQTSQPLKFPPVSGYIMVMPSPHGASASWIGGMYGPFPAFVMTWIMIMILCAETTWTLKFKVNKYHNIYITFPSNLKHHHNWSLNSSQKIKSPPSPLSNQPYLLSQNGADQRLGIPTGNEDSEAHNGAAWEDLRKRRKLHIHQISNQASVHASQWSFYVVLTTPPQKKKLKLLYIGRKGEGGGWTSAILKQIFENKKMSSILKQSALPHKHLWSLTWTLNRN